MKNIQNCGKCGLCLTVCPVYKELKEEQASPRARLQLIKFFENNTLISSPRLKQIVSKCLMCGSCAAICPSGIDHYSKFMEMRRKMVQNHGETPAVKSLIWLLAKEYRLRVAGKVAKTGQKMVPEVFREKYRLGNIALEHLPKFNKIPFRESIAEEVEPEGAPNGSVVYFTGCATNYIFDDTGSSAVNILTQMGYRVIIPKNQTCCSIPMLFHGAADEARENIITNIRALTPDTNVDAIIVDCATCGTALKKEYPAFLTNMGIGKNRASNRDSGLKELDMVGMAREISSKTVDLLSFIEQRMNILIPLLNKNQKSKGKSVHRNINGELSWKKEMEKIRDSVVPTSTTSVTYHAPCHLKNSSSGYSHVERLLRALPSVEYHPALDVDQCCGGGGTFFYEHPDISLKMVTKKIESAKESAAKLWLTDCPVCRINLGGNMGTSGNSIKECMPVIHPATLIDAILRRP